MKTLLRPKICCVRTIVLLILSGAAFGAAAVIGVLGGADLWAVGLGLAGVGLLAGASQLIRSTTKLIDPVLLHEAVEAMPLPVAVYDRDERLRASNVHYREDHVAYFGDRIGETPVETPTYSEIVAASAGPNATPEQRAEHVKYCQSQQPPLDGPMVERYFPLIGWNRVGKRRLRSGGTVRVGVQINDLKAREEELLRAIRYAKASEDAKSKFLATMSHELRTPLNGILGMATLLLADDLSDSQRRNVGHIHVSGTHLLDLIDRVLEISKLSSEAEVASTVDFSLRETVEEVLVEARHTPAASSIELTTEIASDIEDLRTGDRRGLRQVLTNLVGNASKFTDHGSVSVVLSAVTQSIVRIEVHDTGIGIPEVMQDKIFAPFTQADDSLTRRYGGAGLGLSISYEIVKRMGGRIGVESQEGVGSSFWFELPLKCAAAEQQIRAAS